VIRVMPPKDTLQNSFHEQRDTIRRARADFPQP